ncbi:hypothetical protein AC578_925 [Pseudocercospora eumusae]|uniref:Uncharacterized protein n=1 Tax=Pseudocercospora eumusae TaxID=321146 RepID=A0A139HBY5_9PEZI|nr:hypothetical protein AC578_925 [Pseudocercospora eumusae]
MYPSSLGPQADIQFRHDQDPEDLQLVGNDKDDGMTFGDIQEAYFEVSDGLQGTASADTLVFLPWVCLPTGHERDALGKGISVEHIQSLEMNDIEAITDRYLATWATKVEAIREDGSTDT